MPTTDERSDGRRIRSVRITLNILDLLGGDENWTLSSIAAELGHSKSTVHSHLKTLEEEELVVPTDEGYRLGFRLLDLARGVRDRFADDKPLEMELGALAAETGETVQFGIEENGHVLCLYSARGRWAIKTETVGTTSEPLCSTSFGRSILAYLPADRRTEIINAHESDVRTGQGSPHRESLRDEIAEIQERGYAVDDEVDTNGLRCVAAPVESEGMVVGVVGITGPPERLTVDRIDDELTERVRWTANTIELCATFA